MPKRYLLGLAIVVTFCVGEETLRAQGNSQMATRSLRAMSRAGSHGAASQSMQGLNRANERIKLRGAPMSRAAAGLQRAGSVTPRSSDAPVPSPDSEQFSANQQRILDHRLGQAEHLRALSEKHGNERLLETADRMEANAQENFSRHTNLSQDGQDDATLTPTTNTPPLTERERPVKRGFWFKSR